MINLKKTSGFYVLPLWAIAILSGAYDDSHVRHQRIENFLKEENLVGFELDQEQLSYVIDDPDHYYYNFYCDDWGIVSQAIDVRFIRPYVKGR